MAALLSELDRTRLRWRARRGLLENDLIITRFLDAWETTLTDEDVASLTQLFELGDNELLDLLLARKEPDGALDTPEIRTMLGRLRTA
ncbi:MAG: succinate dehydrogenase assembly factor 2 [Corticimicrobacter sp.]|uniref:FAD assembly factor SdhE n=1 Tax=Corticimicrobacter sp. TaxID=2678536 RepID=UPI0032DADE61